MADMAVQQALDEGKELTFEDLAAAANYTEEEIGWIKIFWEPAFNGSWLYVSKEMLIHWFGYSESNKGIYGMFIEKLESNFTKNVEYKMIDKDSPLLTYYRQFVCLTFSGHKIGTGRGSYQIKYYAVTGETFKSLLLMANTAKGKAVRKYYIKTESLAATMNRYMAELREKQMRDLQSEKDQLKIEKTNLEADFNRLHNISVELLSYKKRVSKDETVYIVSTASYARQGIFKIGRTKTKMERRSAAHNVTHIAGDKVKVIREFAVNDAVLVERNIHTKLSGLLLEGEKEFFLCPFDLLESVVDLIVNNDDEENEVVNRIIDTVYRIKQHAFDSVEWTNGIPDDLFRETITISDGDEKLAELDVSKWNQTEKTRFVDTCLAEYAKTNGEILWKDIQVNMINKFKEVHKLPKSKFKALDWRDTVRSVADEKRLAIKWRGK